jgi:hypothetical protein
LGIFGVERNKKRKEMSLALDWSRLYDSTKKRLQSKRATGLIISKDEV